MIQLRDYQYNIISEVRRLLSQGYKRIVCQSPTGSGKTVIFSYIVKNASDKGNRCLIITDRIELLKQAGGTFQKLELSYSEITAGNRYIPDNNVSVAMIETLYRRLKSNIEYQFWLNKINIIIIDECHICRFDKLFNFISDDCIVLGFSATPIRFGAMPELSKYFQKIIQGPKIEKLIQDGWLSEAKSFGVPINLSNVKIKAGEFDENDLQNIYSSSEVFGGLKHNIDIHGAEMKTIIYCPTIETSKTVAKQLNCLHVDGEMHKSKRESILREYENNANAIISNVGILTTGYDSPETSRIVLYRATKSLPLFLQMCGRGSRITENKRQFYILDFGNNILRHGFWQSDRIWTLENNRKRRVRADREDLYPIKDCPQCGYLVAINTRQCPSCGYVWVKEEQERRFVELQELEYGSIIKKINNGASIQEIETIRIAKGYKVGWLLHQLKRPEQFIEYGHMKKYHPLWAQYQINRYLNNKINENQINDIFS